jgi:hypothetical protein
MDRLRVEPRTIEPVGKGPRLEGSRMEEHTGARVVHRYDVATHRIPCGAAAQSRSTKHASAVTCATCRALLRGPRAVPALDGAVDDARGG